MSITALSASVTDVLVRAALGLPAPGTEVRPEWNSMLRADVQQDSYETELGVRLEALQQQMAQEVTPQTQATRPSAPRGR